MKNFKEYTEINEAMKVMSLPFKKKKESLVDAEYEFVLNGVKYEIVIRDIGYSTYEIIDLADEGIDAENNNDQVAIYIEPDKGRFDRSLGLEFRKQIVETGIEALARYLKRFGAKTVDIGYLFDNPEPYFIERTKKFMKEHKFKRIYGKYFITTE